MALVHHPVLDASGSVVTTAVTNLDIHDLARSARTYGVTDYFVVHPIAAQRELVERIRDHWLTGSSGRRIPDRKEALSVLRIVETLEHARTSLGDPEVWVTAARDVAPPLSLLEARTRIAEGDRPVLLVFGTGWGLSREVIEGADACLEPIRGRSDYNHLSVRAACAILLDRLLA